MYIHPSNIIEFMRLFLLTISSVVLFVFCMEQHAQCGELRGIIRDAETEEIINGASFFLLNRGAGGYTGSDGRFSVISEKAGPDTLLCSRIGYRDSRVQVMIPDDITVLLVSKPIALEEVVVISRTPAELPAHERSTSSLTVIESGDIPDRSITLDKVLDKQVGVDIRTMGGEGSRSEISIRGSTTEQVSVYLDGVQVTAGGSGLSGLSSIPLGQVKNIEVYRGSSPGSFGAGAMGGIINISTIPPDDKMSASGSLSYGSHNSNHESVSTSIGLGSLNRFSFSFDNRASENDFSFYDDRGTYLDGSDDGWEIRRNSDIRVSTFMGGWDRKIKKNNARFRTSVLYRSTERGVSGLGRRPAYDARFSSDNTFWQGRFDWKHNLTSQAWISSEERRFFDPKDEAGRRGRQNTVSDINIQGFQTQLKHITGMALTHFRAEVRRETFESSDSYQSALTVPSERLHLGTGIETEVMFLGSAMLLQPRLNYTHIADKIQDVGTFVGSVSDEIRSVGRDTFTAAIGWRYRVSEPYIVRANIGLYTREPDFNEMFGDTGDTVGNTRLDNERSLNIDSGFHMDSSGVTPEIDMTVFFRKADDLIQRRNYGDYLISENIAKAQIRGVECILNRQLDLRNVFYRISFSYQQALNKSDATVFRKNRYYNKILPYHPELQFDTSAKIDITSRLRFGWDMSYESDCFRGPSNLPEEMIDARTIHDVVLDFLITGKLSTQFEISNIAGKRYVDRWGYPRPGRAYYLSLSWKVEKSKSH
jgi:outer membrane cobalamin receptor